MRETFLFVGADPDFAAALFATLEAAGKFVIRAHSVDEAMATLHRLGLDSVLVDPALADDPALTVLKSAAVSTNSDFWILDAARNQQLVNDLASGA